MKSLWLMLALAGAVPVQTASAEPLPPKVPDLKCKASEESDRAQCFILQLGAPPTLVAENVLLSLVDVKDSRCPLDVLCPWAGFVTTTMVLKTLDDSVPAQKLSLSLDPRYDTTNLWVDEATGLTVILEDVSRRGVGPQPLGWKPKAKVTVGYHLAPNPYPNM